MLLKGPGRGTILGDTDRGQVEGHVQGRGPGRGGGHAGGQHMGPMGGWANLRQGCCDGSKVGLRLGAQGFQHDSDQVQHPDHAVHLRDSGQQVEAAAKDRPCLGLHHPHVGLAVLHQPILLLLVGLHITHSFWAYVG